MPTIAEIIAAHEEEELQRRLTLLRQRDGDNCHLCEMPALFGKQYQRSLLRATLDHMKPKSQGGTADLYNLKIAHFECNQIRGVRVVSRNLRQECFNRIRLLLLKGRH